MVTDVASRAPMSAAVLGVWLGLQLLAPSL